MPPPDPESTTVAELVHRPGEGDKTAAIAIRATRAMSLLVAAPAARRYLSFIVLLAPIVMTQRVGAPPLTHDAYELPKTVVVQVLACAALAAWSFDAVKARTQIRGITWLIPVGILVAWTALSAAVSSGPGTSLIGAYGRLLGLTTTFTYGLIAFVAVQVFKTSSDLRTLGRLLGASGLLVGLFGVSQAFGLDPIFYLERAEFPVGRAFATFGNPVFLAGYIVLATPLVFATALTEETGPWRIACWSAFAALFVAMIGTATRSGVAVMALELALLYALVRVAKVGLGAAGIAATIAALAGAVAVFVRSMDPSRAAMNLAYRFSTLPGLNEGSGLQRRLIFGVAWNAIKSRPLVGFGPDRFGAAAQELLPAKYTSALPIGAITNNAHSVPLQIAATAGLVAAVAWFIALAIPLVGSIPTIRLLVPTARGVIPAGLWLSCAGYALFSLVGISTSGAEAPFWVLLGALASTFANMRVVHVPVGVRALLRIACCLLLVGAVVLGSLDMLANHRFLREREIVRGLAQGDPIGVLRGALSLAPLNPRYAREMTLLLPPGPELRRAVKKALFLEPSDPVTLAVRADLDEVGP